MKDAYEYRPNIKTYRYHVAKMFECVGWNSKAKKNFEKAVMVGDGRAMVSLGRMYECSCGVEHNSNEAVKWYRKSAELGNSKAMYDLGMMYVNGCGVEQDDGEAVKWYTKSAENNNISAIKALIDIYEKGLGCSVKANPEKATYYRCQLK